MHERWYTNFSFSGISEAFRTKLLKIGVTPRQAQGDLITHPNRKAGRVRVHKTIGDASCEVLAHRNDRDELAATNMLLTALRVLKGSTWPAHLTRSTSGA